MIEIRPLSDLTYNLPEIEKAIEQGKQVFLTKNGYGSMVVLSMEDYSKLTNTDSIEVKLDEADLEAKNTSVRLTHKEVFGSIREAMNTK